MSWARSPVAVRVREVILMWLLAPLMCVYTRRRVRGHEVLDEVSGPVLFVATHASHMDTPLVLQSLPRAWRRRTAVAAASDYFYVKPALAWAVSLAFNTVPVRRQTAGTGGDAVSDLDRLIGEGWSLVIYAEGTRSRDGSVGRLHAGAAVLAAQHGLPIVPVYVSGTHAVMPAGRRWARVRAGRHPIEVHFGPPVVPRDDEHRTEVMERLRLFFESCGAVTTPDQRLRSNRPRAAARQ